MTSAMKFIDLSILNRKLSHFRFYLDTTKRSWTCSIKGVLDQILANFADWEIKLTSICK